MKRIWTPFVIEKFSAAATNTGAENINMVNEIMAFSPQQLAMNWKEFSSKLAFDADQLPKPLAKEELEAMSVRQREDHEDARARASHDAWHARFLACDFEYIV
jgi:hypothetical protein